MGRAGKRVRVLVTDDSLTLRKRLVEVLSADPQIEVVGEAADGLQAVELCARLHPDVITMDMMMPRMTGLQATEHIMAFCPTPVLIVSASFNRGEVFNTFDALRAGAVDVLDKPSGDALDTVWEANLRATVKVVSRVAVITHPRGRIHVGASSQAHATGLPMPAVRRTREEPSARERQAPTTAPVPTTAPPSRARFSGRRRTRVLAVGASTGGPPAVAEILRHLPTRGQVPMLLVIHIGDAFAEALADWLGTHTRVTVAVARDRMPVPRQAMVLMPPPDHHLLVRDGLVRVSRDAERHSCRPSVDLLFESVAREYGPNAAAALLTGMGRDGAAGLKALRSAGSLTAVQDESTSVVFGMPREAIRLGATERVLPLGELARWLASEAATPQVEDAEAEHA